MATIGLDRLYYAPITEDPLTGDETYATPVPLAKAISAELSVEVAEAILYADDGPSEIVKSITLVVVHSALSFRMCQCLPTSLVYSQSESSHQ